MQSPSAAPSIRLKRNKHLAQRFFQATWEQGDIAAIDHLTRPDFIADYPVLPAPLDRTAFKAWVADVHFVGLASHGCQAPIHPDLSHRRPFSGISDAPMAVPPSRLSPMRPG